MSLLTLFHIVILLNIRGSSCIIRLCLFGFGGGHTWQKYYNICFCFLLYKKDVESIEETDRCMDKNEGKDLFTQYILQNP